jgi:hypothetical protein
MKQSFSLLEAPSAPAGAKEFRAEGAVALLAGRTKVQEAVAKRIALTGGEAVDPRNASTGRYINGTVKKTEKNAP